MSMNPPPPMFPACGCTTAKANPAATAASMAFPPLRITSTPASVANEWTLATIAFSACEGRMPALAAMVIAEQKRTSRTHWRRNEKFCGVRGSTPTPQIENLRYGGNTSCVEVRIDDKMYVFDCGTGFRNLGKHLSTEAGGAPICAHIFLSHFHWDHIQGIPFFNPLYGDRDNSFVFHSSSRTRGLQQALEEQMADPYFPVNMSEMAARRQFSNIDEGSISLDKCTVHS